ncbi:MAG: hypothetical protein RJA33_33 [Actinomycetota bacterium]|jgi:hypothetical protein
MRIELHGEDSNSHKDWSYYSGILEDFLNSEETELVFCNSLEYHDLVSEVVSSEIDFMQFYRLQLHRKGELGIREFHWWVTLKISESGLFNNKITSIGPFAKRIVRIRERREQLKFMFVNPHKVPNVIPHYVEPVSGSFRMCRRFARALLDFNSEGFLTFERSCFAIARSSNFSCVRISAL